MPLTVPLGGEFIVLSLNNFIGEYKMSNVCLVTGANGHLGGNVVRALIAQGETVRAGMRDIQNVDNFFPLELPSRLYRNARYRRNEKSPGRCRYFISCCRGI